MLRAEPLGNFFWKGSGRPERLVEPRFKRFVNDRRWPQGFEVASLNDVRVADHIIRVERLKEGYRDVLGSLGIIIEDEMQFPASRGFQRPKEATREAMFMRPWVNRKILESKDNLRSVLPCQSGDRSPPHIHLNEERLAVRYQFPEQYDCGLAYWVPIDTYA
ncbi:hypothetical protein [Phaeobacter sp. C3_T13_0]|uniref:hypothetical protein n=1 Tax=Phaeobacter cretensis TaxID=3342641 RepID=UPI0039BCB711